MPPEGYLRLMRILVPKMAANRGDGSGLAHWRFKRSADNDPVVQKYRLLIPQLMSEQDIPGLAVAVVDDQGILWIEGFGFTDDDHKIAITPDTIFMVVTGRRSTWRGQSSCSSLRMGRRSISGAMFLPGGTSS